MNEVDTKYGSRVRWFICDKDHVWDGSKHDEQKGMWLIEHVRCEVISVNGKTREMRCLSCGAIWTE